MNRPVTLGQLLIAVFSLAAMGAIMSYALARHGSGEPAFAHDDPRDYCTAVDTVDEPDLRWAGKTLPDDVRKAAVEAFDEDIVAHNIVLWRCMDGEVWWCMFWGTNWCPQRDINRTAPAHIYERCARLGDSEGFSRAEQRLETAWWWACEEGRPVIIGGGLAGLDHRYFTAALWVNLGDGRNPTPFDNSERTYPP
jgi:hypothetical protein